MQPIPRFISLIVLLAMTGFAAVGFLTLRRDVAGLQTISRDGILWSATQMEVELLRFHVSLAELAEAKTEAAVDVVREQFDQLWSRVFMMSQGRIGEVMRRYEEGLGSLSAIAAYLERIDPELAALQPDDLAKVNRILREIEAFEQELRLYTLRVVRADTDVSTALRERIQSSAQTTAMLSLAAVLVSVLSLFLILRENRRQRDLVIMTRQVAEEAERSSRAKSRFLTMMSHELRNPLNGILGPLALLEQSGLGERQRRLIDQVRQCGQSMLQMLSGLLDYAEIQDGRLKLRVEVLEMAALARAIRDSLGGVGGSGVPVTVVPGSPERIEGDPERLQRIFVSLIGFLLELRLPDQVRLELGHNGELLLGTIAFGARHAAIDWKLDLLMGMGEAATDQVSSDALRPLVARGLISASRGTISLEDAREGERAIVVRIPARLREASRIRVHLETRSAALATIYQAALRSERIEFSDERVDVVLVDSTSIDEEPLMERLRERFPGALFVSLGHPQHPAYFDDVVASPRDMTGLRKSILSHLAS